MDKKDIKKIIEIIKNFEMCNPTLVSDGCGEYSDIYKINEDDLPELKEELSNAFLKK